MADSGRSLHAVLPRSKSTTESKPRKTTKSRLTSSPKLVWVEWVDAVVSGGWEIGRANSKVDLVTSIGWLLDRNESEVVLAADISTDTDGALHTNRRLAIPAPWIKQLKEVKL